MKKITVTFKAIKKLERRKRLHAGPGRTSKLYSGFKPGICFLWGWSAKPPWGSISQTNWNPTNKTNCWSCRRRNMIGWHRKEIVARKEIARETAAVICSHNLTFYPRISDPWTYKTKVGAFRESNAEWRAEVVGSVGWEGGEDSVVLRQRRAKVLTWFQITVGELVSKFTVQVEWSAN